ncbi:MAG: hypothetical protein M1337_07330 [Actinobacteria bacterium]|nr:hypothetical protein [Actinomycetota bacterium]
MKKRKMVVTVKDASIEELVRRVDPTTLMSWACDCAERALPYFETKYPEDARPRRAIETGRAWARTGVFHMAEIRGASLAAHAAARDVAGDDPARSAARAAGQAVATAHVPTHAIAAAIYAATAFRDAADPAEAESAALREREWQLEHLRKLQAK